jgi:hypothetical protein
VWNVAKIPTLIFEIACDEPIVNFMANLIYYNAKLGYPSDTPRYDSTGNRHPSNGVSASQNFARGCGSLTLNKRELYKDKRDERKRMKDKGANSSQYISEGINEPLYGNLKRSLGPEIGSIRDILCGDLPNGSGHREIDSNSNGNIENHILIVYTKKFIRLITFSVDTGGVIRNSLTGEGKLLIFYGIRGRK